MRRKEEKMLMGLAILGLFIIIFTIIIQIADSEIDAYNEEIRNKELLNIHYLSVVGNYQVSAVYYLIASFDPDRLSLNKTEIENNFKEAMQEKEKIGSMAIQKANEINDLKSKGTIWTDIRDIAYICQLSLIIVSTIGHLYILYEIHKRTKKS